MTDLRAGSTGLDDLHRGCIVVDSMGPPGPSVHTPAMIERLDRLADVGVPPALAIDEMDTMADRALLREELDGFWEGWDRSGVDVSSVTIGAFGPRPFTYENATRDAARWTRKFDAIDRYVKVTTAADAERAHSEGHRGIILNLQNTSHFGDDIGKLEELHGLGVRIVQLTYNTRNLVGDGCTERNPSGLSMFGLEVVRALNDLGILIDVSHCSTPTAFDAVEASQAPIAITHGFARSVNPHDRGAPDDLIRAIGASGGYVGVVCVPFFLTSEPRATLDHLVGHIEHIAGLTGIEHVGIGTDWAPPVPQRLRALLTAEVERLGFRPEHRVDWASTVEGLDAWEDWPNITRALTEAGFTDEEVHGIVGGNFLRLFRRVVG